MFFRCSILALLLLAISQPNLASPPKAVPLEARVFAKVPFGKDSGEIPPSTIGSPGEGVPTSFIFGENGRIHLLIPHSHEILIIGKDGAVEKTIELRNAQGEELPKKAFLYDLAFDASSNYLVLDRSGGWIVRFSPEGRALGTFGHNVGAESFYFSKQQNVIVKDAALGVLNIFDDSGAFIGELEGPYLSPYVSAEGKFVRSKIIAFKRAFLWLRGSSAPLPRLFTVIRPSKDAKKLYQAKCLGFDEEELLYLLTTELNDEGEYKSHVYKFDEKTRLRAYFEIAPNMERLAEIPRFFRLHEDGRIITFRLSAKNYEILVYDTAY